MEVLDKPTGARLGRMSKFAVIDQILANMEEVGDLPVFSATVNHICSASSDPGVDAMELSQEVLKDTNLSIKLLKLANSPFYNRGISKINVISRAVIILGFNQVKNLSLTLKLIESFQHEHPGIDMDRLLVQSLIAAGFARDMAIKCGIKDVEGIYTSTLLHGLGEIAVAYFLPDKYIELQQLNNQNNHPAFENEKDILGTSLGNIGKELADAWEFSKTVISTMDDNIKKIKSNITKTHELTHVLASLSSKVVGSLYCECKSKNIKFNELMRDLGVATGINVDEIESSLKQSFEMSCDLAKDYGLDRKKLMPIIADTDEDGRDKIARQMSYYASSQLPATKVEVTVDESDCDTPSSDLNPLIQLQYIQEITSLITDSARVNTILIKVLQGIHEGVGFNRVVLCLLTPDKKKYVGRIAVGDDGEVLKSFFQKNINLKKDIFSKVAVQSTDLIVEDVHSGQWEQVLTPEFHNIVKANSCIVSALKSGVKPLGFIYGDTGESGSKVSVDQHRGFIQFVAQARLALQTCR